MDLGGVLSTLDSDGAGLDVDALVAMEPESLVALVRDVEVAARRLDAARVVLTDALDRSGAHTVDGHRSAKASLVHVGRLSGREAHRRVRTARMLRRLPELAAAVAAGSIPIEIVHEITIAASNPRVAEHLEAADPVFAREASSRPHAEVADLVGEWERLADADGPDPDRSHRCRQTNLGQGVDAGWWLRCQMGSLQGAVFADTLAAYESAEALADHDDAVARLGPDATPGQWARSAGQRRTDALVAMAGAAAQVLSGARSEPLVNIICDQATFEAALARLASDPASGRHLDDDGAACWACGCGCRVGSADSARSGSAAPGGEGPWRDGFGPDDPGPLRFGPDGLPVVGHPGRQVDPLQALRTRVCATVSGHRIDPTDAVLAALVGHVRRVVVDGEGRITELGRRQRLFTGAAREVAILQAALDRRGGISCLWSGCGAPPAALEVDHQRAWRAGGCTSPHNAALLCGHHNRLKESGYTPARGPDGTWTFLRPDGTPTTPAA